jgi:hypothetical protein
MKLRIALALCTLATPLYAQSLPTPNLGVGTKFNGTNLQNAATKATGTSVTDPGTGALEALLPVQTFTGASHAFIAADLYKETRRSNAGAAMTDTFPGTSTVGLANGTTIQFNNVDTSASVTISAGTGTTINGVSSVSVAAGRSTRWVYDSSAANWRPTMNSLTAVLGPPSAANANIATFNGTSGAVIQDSGKALPSGGIAGTSDTQTLTNKTLTSPSVTTPTGIVKGDVGLPNVDNTSDATKNSATATLTNKTIDTSGPNTLKIAGIDLSTGWASYTPTVTAGSGSLTSVSAVGRYKQIGKTVFFALTITITTNGTAGTNVLASLPVTASSAAGVYHVVAGRALIAGSMLQGAISPSGTTIDIRLYNNAYGGANNELLAVAGSYESS